VIAQRRGNYGENKAMRLEEFEELLERRGADLATWPWRRRRAARRLLGRSAAAQEAYDQARALDGWIGDAVRPVPARAGLKAQLCRIPQNHPRENDRLTVGVMLKARPWRGFCYAGSTAAMASLVAGVLVGTMQPPAGSGLAQMVDIASLVYGLPPDQGRSQ
jgi:hypothetical protein